MKKLILPLFSFLIIIVFGLALGEVSNVGIKEYQVHSVHAAATATCIATDITSFKNCISQVNNGTASAIELDSFIACSGANACAFTFNNLVGPINIYGKASSGAGFHRLDLFNYNIFSITNSQNITISNLVFDESPSGICSGNCTSPVLVYYSSGITLDGLSIYNSKLMGIEMYNVQNISLKNSTIINSGKFGLWLSNDVGFVSSGVIIQNNLFKDTASNAILTNMVGNAASPNLIKGNTFIHNHRAAVFNVCGSSGTDPCGGGQIDITSPASNLRIEGNIVKDGKIDNSLSPPPVSGLEFNSNSSIAIIGNDIHNNTGWGIIVNGGTTTSNISITNNKLYLNSAGNIVFPGSVQSGNCFMSGCMTMLSGVIYGYPNPCLLSSSGTCTSNINWSTNDATNVQVKVNGTGLFSTNQSGSQDTPWISSNRFDLLAGTTLLNSVIVVGTGDTSADTIPPVISNISATNIGQFSADINWSTNEPADGQVEFLNPCPSTGCLTPIVSTLTTSHTINVSNLLSSTLYPYRIFSRDAAGNLATSANQSFTTTSAPDSTPPTVSITSPANGSTVSGTITISATASDNVGVVGLQFTLDGNNLQAEDTTSPYSISWNTTTTTNGPHTLRAVARDAAGNTQGNSVTVTVSNVTPTPTPTPSPTPTPTPTPTPLANGPFIGQYYSSNNKNKFNRLVFTQTDATINFDWGLNSPDLRLSNNNFAIYWSGNISFPTSAVYSFLAITDDGMRVWIDGKPVLDKWFNQYIATYNFNVSVTAGNHLIEVAYYEKNNTAVAKLNWAPAVVLGRSTYQFRNTLAKGQSNSLNDVLALQQIFYKLGLLSIEPTGYFGKLTEDAVEKLQAQYGLPQTGIVGKMTKKVLNKLGLN